MFEKSKIHCVHPRCSAEVTEYGERYHSVYDLPQKYVNPHPLLPTATATCQRCGSYMVDGEWVMKCHSCGKVVTSEENLHGLFVPHLCIDCQRAATAADRAAGNICRMCGQTHNNCSC